MKPTTTDQQPDAHLQDSATAHSHKTDNAHSVPPRFAQPSQSDQPVDQNLVNETRKQISALIQEISELAQSEVTTEDFYDGFLTRTTSALASVGGAIWTVKDQGNLALTYHINMSATGLPKDRDKQVQHNRLLMRLAESGEPTLVGPKSSGEEPDQPGNPTGCLLVICPLKIDQQIVGLVEVFQRSGTGPTTQRGYLRFLLQMCDIASDFLKNRRIRDFQDQQKFWNQLEGFIRSTHKGLNPQQTAYTIANEGKRIIGCDRASVAFVKNGRCEIKSVSGLDSIERRASQLKQLNQLVKAVSRTCEPLWYFGNEDDLPPQIESRLHEYLDDSHAKVIGIEPLFKSNTGNDEQDQPTNRSKENLIGALIVEQLKDDHVCDRMVEKTGTIARHGGDALSNAMEYDSVFLMPLWKQLGKATWFVQARQLPKTLTALCIVVTLIAGAFLVPYPFTLSSNGKLAPTDRVEIFAQVNGVLEEISVPSTPDEQVKENQLLARMTNNELSVQINDLRGQLRQTTEQINKLLRARNARNSVEDDMQIEGELAKSWALQESLQNQIKIKTEQLKKLNVYSPIDGYVIDWQVRQKLLRRPINRGQHLMTVIAPDSNWIVEFEVPEKRVGHLLEAQGDSDEPVKVTFTLASQPGKQYTGKVVAIERRMDVRSDEGNTSLVKVAFDSSRVKSELLRAGTRIRGKFHCGTRSFGRVWLHDLIETVQSNVLFWF